MPPIRKQLIGSLDGAAYADGVFVDNVFIRLGVTLLVVYVPSVCLEEGIEKLAAEVGFIVMPGRVGITVLLETLRKVKDCFW